MSTLKCPQANAHIQFSTFNCPQLNAHRQFSAAKFPLLCESTKTLHNNKHIKFFKLEFRPLCYFLKPAATWLTAAVLASSMAMQNKRASEHETF